MNLIGVDYGTGSDIPMYSVLKKTKDTWELIDSGKVEDFDYSKYVSSKHQLIGEADALKRFKLLLNK